MRERVYYVYMLASRIGGTLYIGVTSDLVRRVYQHREKLLKGFTERYGVARLVHFERFSEAGAAIQRDRPTVQAPGGNGTRATVRKSYNMSRRLTIT